MHLDFLWMKAKGRTLEAWKSDSLTNQPSFLLSAVRKSVLMSHWHHRNPPSPNLILKKRASTFGVRKEDRMWADFPANLAQSLLDIRGTPPPSICAVWIAPRPEYCKPAATLDGGHWRWVNYLRINYSFEQPSFPSAVSPFQCQAYLCPINSKPFISREILTYS